LVLEDEFVLIGNCYVWPSGCLTAPVYGKLEACSGVLTPPVLMLNLLRLELNLLLLLGPSTVILLHPAGTIEACGVSGLNS
jgi:hypothetical protein